MKKWYEALFENYANTYDKESFTRGTLQEVDFIEQELNFNKDAKILDVACGTGRHSIELSKRRYKVTGFDLSENMITRAKQKADEAGATVNFSVADARKFKGGERYDLAIMLCEGGFSLMETDEMNYEILKNLYGSLAEGGKAIFTCLNALFPLFHSVKELIDNGTFGVHETNFDLMTFRDHSNYKIKDDDGKEMNLDCNERYYAPSEIAWMLKQIGFSHFEIWGGEVGNFQRGRKVATSDYELLVLAEK